jgi:reductive dehalogenase
MGAEGSQYAWTPQCGEVRNLTRFGLDPWNPAELDMSWDDARTAVKHAALFYGASLAGVAELNPLWLYSDHFSPTPDNRGRAIPVLREGDRFEQTDDSWYIPESMNRVVIMAFEEDYNAIANSPGRIASAGVGNGYSRMANTAFFIAEFLRVLGYRALPAGNEVGLSIPMAVDAGLGEIGRMGLLMTPKYGPRVRLAKVITDMPLTVDQPIRFGVREFCEVCMLCATHCPSGAITEGPPTSKGRSVSNNPGTLKWYVEGEKCYDFNGFSCSNCKRVCPFNKPNNSWLHRLTRAIVDGKVGAMDTLMVKLDQAGGYGTQTDSSDFWRRDGSKTITARERM